MIHDIDVSVVVAALYKGAYTELFTDMPNLVDMNGWPTS